MLSEGTMELLSRPAKAVTNHNGNSSNDHRNYRSDRGSPRRVLCAPAKPLVGSRKAWVGRVFDIGNKVLKLVLFTRAFA